MKEKLKFIVKLSKGNNKGFADMIVVLFSIMFMFIVLFISVENYTDITLGIKKQQIARSYMLIMETKGYLPEAEQNELILELEQMGVTNISISGTSVAPVGYGQPIYLVVTGNIKMKSKYGITEGYDWIESGTVPFKITAKSTAKY